ncbi:hypothetical protein MASR2M18_06530 [Ignavibacteria bacterium]|jgi:lipoate-protein ligase A|nr:lipoate--protein ligase family protein [Bacteroidota bacterium]MCZ2132434.1 lipoate--protein ligase family protein [Bacteroidota bacterium]
MRTATDKFGYLNAPLEIRVEEERSGEYNMSADAAYLNFMQEQADAAPLLRLYSWQPFAASLGRHQRESDINTEECKKRGFDIVRRPTGGRAVLHAREITYSLHIRLSEAVHSQDIYRDVHLWIAAGLANLGAQDVEFAKHQPDFREEYRAPRSAACFASAARHELLWHGRKLVGSAQRIAGNVLLQHGSILLADGHEEIADILHISEEDRADIRSYLRSASVTLEEITSKRFEFGIAADSLLSAL